MTDCCATCTSWHENAGADFGECRGDGSPRMGEYTHGARVVCDRHTAVATVLNSLRSGLAALAAELANPLIEEPTPPPPAEEEPTPDPVPDPDVVAAPDPTPSTAVEPVTVPEEPTNG